MICDVFTDTPLAGNPLAVFTDARSIPEKLLQAIAREMNLSETVFVYPAAKGGHARIRIFTPFNELPFAGHPVLGSAFVLAAPLQLPTIVLETGIGLVPIVLERDGPRITFGRMTQPLPTVSAEPAAAAIARAPAPSALAVASAASWRTSFTTTRAPSSAKRSQMARPMPEPPPVTSATLSFSLMRLLCGCGGRHGRRNSPRATLTAHPPTSTLSMRSRVPLARANSVLDRPISAPCAISISSPGARRPWRTR